MAISSANSPIISMFFLNWVITKVRRLKRVKTMLILFISLHSVLRVNPIPELRFLNPGIPLY